ncbi:hypothetical protein PUMCH_002289 [Australozyma saopauloensis]|uniref:Capsule polysaccharide biosynthesis protein n=1 Tax=Australozyma saopauloensis TaxID=291208 RepID=A0AAX4HB53_9ASCO|nr:hypothetical protein PUMCH_002289 [[Candida] saopauloensis]
MFESSVLRPQMIKVALALFALSSYKLLPFAYMIRFYYQVFRHIFTKRSGYVKTKENTYGIGNQPLDLFRQVAYRSYTSPLEIDMYLHKSNSTYFTDLDIARTKLVCVIFQKLFMKYWNNESGEFKKRSINNCPYIPVGTVQCTFKREFKVFQKYSVVSSVFAWDHKWLYVVLKFVLSKGVLSAVAVTKYVFKRNGRITMKPAEFIAECGLLNNEVEKINAENYKLISYLETSEGLEAWASTLDSKVMH